MNKIAVSAYDLAQRFVGIKAVPGVTSNPQVLAMLRLEDPGIKDDDVAWCSAFVNYIAWLLRLPRSKDLSARSWLLVGQVVSLQDHAAGFDVVILQRDSDEPQPGPEEINALGHVGFYAGVEDQMILVLGGNQANSVSITRKPKKKLLGVRRLA